MNIKTGTCRGPNCGKGIFWLSKTDKAGNAKLHPFDDEQGLVSHFTTCVDSAAFRRRTIPKGVGDIDGDPSRSE